MKFNRNNNKKLNINKMESKYKYPYIDFTDL